MRSRAARPAQVSETRLIAPVSHNRLLLCDGIWTQGSLTPSVVSKTLVLWSAEATATQSATPFGSAAPLVSGRSGATRPKIPISQIGALGERRAAQSRRPHGSRRGITSVPSDHERHGAARRGITPDGAV